MGVNTKATRGIYLNDVRTANSNVVTDAAILNTTNAVLNGHSLYHDVNNKLGALVEARRLVYNAAHPDT